jgi:hypothetical protein
MNAIPTLLLLTWMLPLQPAAPTAAQDPLTDAKRADILRLLQVTGSAQIGLQFADAMISEMNRDLQAANPDLPPRAFDIVKEEVTKLMQQRVSSLLDVLVPIYQENFTHEEIKGLVQFYTTPLGKKVIQKMPAVMQQGMAAGEAWGQSMMEVLEQRLEKRLKEVIK